MLFYARNVLRGSEIFIKRLDGVSRLSCSPAAITVYIIEGIRSWATKGPSVEINSGTLFPSHRRVVFAFAGAMFLFGNRPLPLEESRTRGILPLLLTQLVE